MIINGAVGVVTGAASGIGRALSQELAKRGAKALALVDHSAAVSEIAEDVNAKVGSQVAIGYSGDVTDSAFRKEVFAGLHDRHGMVNICVPAAGVTRDGLTVKVDKESNKVVVYPQELFRTVMEVNLVAPVYWAMEMVAGIAEERRRKGLKRWEPAEALQGAVIFIGSVSSWETRGRSPMPRRKPVSRARRPP